MKHLRKLAHSLKFSLIPHQASRGRAQIRLHFLRCVLLGFCLVGLGGCRDAKRPFHDWIGEEHKVKVLCTTAQVASLVAEIGGERVAPWVLIRGELDPHSYEMVKGDAEKFARSDLIFYNGLGLEHGASLASLLQRSKNAIAVGDTIQKLSPDRILTKDGVVDPHIWMDISLWEQGITPVVEALSRQDSEGASYYLARAKNLREEMQRAHDKVLETLQKVPEKKRYLVTSHDAFQYFTRSYLANPGEVNWADRFAAPEGLAPEGQLSLRDIQKIIDFVKLKRICVVFPETNVSRDSIRKIAYAGNELGLDISVCPEPLYGDAMSDLSYLEMMQKNAETIAKYL
ncbi:MAG: hypothetical protein ACD_17C00071G0002 [uncultured bacterium]|nr:MAG: hypothetical protein ACD_17C00071G0002 [uncultured bacterium]